MVVFVLFVGNNAKDIFEISIKTGKLGFDLRFNNLVCPISGFKIKPLSFLDKSEKKNCKIYKTLNQIPQLCSINHPIHSEELWFVVPRNVF